MIDLESMTLAEISAWHDEQADAKQAAAEAKAVTVPTPTPREGIPELTEELYTKLQVDGENFQYYWGSPGLDEIPGMGSITLKVTAR